MKDDLLHRIKRLRKTLLLSGLLNIFFIFCCILWTRDAEPIDEFRVSQRNAAKKAYIAEKSAQDVLLLMGAKTIDELKNDLKDKTLVESGFTVRDFALGSLITHHHFHVDKAFSRIEKPKQKRKIAYTDSVGKKREITVYSDAEDAHFEAVITALKEEKWPFTPYGMYVRLIETKDPSLAYAFQLSKEFKNLENLMRKAFVVATQAELLNLALEGPFDNLKMLASLADQESREAKREFLLAYIDSGSEMAVNLLLRSDFEFAVKKTDDKMAMKILGTLTKDIPQSRKCALAMLLSPRGENIWELASKKLYELAEEPVPLAITRRAALERFAPVVVAKTEEPKKKEETPKEIPKEIPVPMPVIKQEKVVMPPKKGKRAYIVQEGDTLWKVGKRFCVDPVQIRELNSLESNYLKPGTLIRLP